MTRSILLNVRLVLRTILACACLAVGLTTADAATVTGMNGFTASIFPNQFDPNGDGVTSGAEATTISFGDVGGGTVDASTQLVRVVNRVDNRNGGGSRITSSDGSASQGFMQFDAVIPFKVGSLLAAQRVAPAFTSAMAYDLQLDGDVVQSGPGTVNLHPYNFTLFDRPINNVSQLRLEIDMADTGGTATMADFAEVVLFEGSFEPIPVTSITASDPASGSTFGSKPGIHDFDGTHNTSGTAGGWAIGNPNPDRFFQLDFGQTEVVRGLVLANWENIPVDGVIRDDGGTIVAEFTMDGSGSVGDILPIRFDTAVGTSLLRVEFGGSDAIGIREAIPLRKVFILAVPEPSTLCLWPLGILGITRARRRRTPRP